MTKGVFYLADGTEVDLRPKLQKGVATSNGTYFPPEGKDGFSEFEVNVPGRDPILEEKTVYANGIYLPGEGKDGFSKFVVNVPQPPPTPIASDSLYPIPALPGYTDAFRLKFGNRAALASTFKAGQTVVFFPTEVRHRVGTESYIEFANNATNYRIFYKFLQNNGTLTCKIMKKNRYADHSSAGTVTGETYGWYAARFTVEASSITYTILCNAAGGKITGTIQTDLYRTATNWGYADTVGNFLGCEAAVIVYPNSVSVSDADLDTMATQYNGVPSGNKYWSLIVDDTRSDALTAYDTVFAPYGVKPAFAVRADFIGTYLNMSAIEGLHAKGCEIMYHGMHHDSAGWGPGYSTATQLQKEDDIDRFLELMWTHGITTTGFAGPHNTPLIASRRNRLLYGRPFNSNAPYTGTAFCDFNSFWLDNMGTASYPGYRPAKDVADSISSGFLSFSTHSQCFDGGSSYYPTEYAGGEQGIPATFIERMRGLMEYLESSGWTYMSPAESFRKSVARYGDLGWATPYNILNGTETNPYYIVSADGVVRHS